MTRFGLRWRGEGAAPAADVARVESAPGAVVGDRSERMLLVEAEDAGALRAVIDDLPGWVLAPEQTYTFPEPPPPR